VGVSPPLFRPSRRETISVFPGIAIATPGGMRALGVVAVLLAGCQFTVDGTKVDSPAAPDPGATTQPQSPPPTSSSPPPGSTDGGVASGADMSIPTTSRVGTPCMTDAQCDTGLFCAKTFYIGLTKIDVPGGYCTADCSKDANVCPMNSFCYSFSFGKYCGSSCPPDPCRKGYQCCDKGGSGGQKACTPDALCD
jgi:hypothetical protein